jgi:hypothetical protein
MFILADDLDLALTQYVEEDTDVAYTGNNKQAEGQQPFDGI